MLLAELGQLAFENRIYSFSHRLRLAAKVDLNTDLIKTHQRAQSHAAGNEFFHPLLRQILNRGARCQ